MRIAIVLFFLIFSYTAFAKQNWCKFDTDFAEIYMLARNQYAGSVKYIRENVPEKKARTGRFRRRDYGHNWPQASIKEQVSKLYGDAEISFDIKPSGKIMIYPKEYDASKPILLFDPSGDYFRITRGSIKNGKVIQKLPYFDIEGKRIIRPPGFTDEQWKVKIENLSHFRAIP